MRRLPCLPTEGRRGFRPQVVTARGEPLLAEMSGVGPLVLAFVEGSSALVGGVDDEVLGAMRAELRGLGAVMIVVGGDSVWSFRPDDEVQRLAHAGELREGELERLRREHGVEPGTALAVFVLDAEARERFEHRAAWAGDPMETLAGALTLAGRAMVEVSRPRRDEAPRESNVRQLSRRELVVTSLVAAFALSLAACKRDDAPATTTPSAAPSASAGEPPVPLATSGAEMDVTLEINGQRRALKIEPWVSLLDALRERLGLTGTKKGCDHGQCGACTVLVDGRRVNACLTLAVAIPGAKVTTIEGLSRGDELHPMQQAFLTEDAFQCGYCTPGQILSAVGLLQEGHARTDDEVREQMSGNICRCGAYTNIVAAIQRVRGAA